MLEYEKRPPAAHPTQIRWYMTRHDTAVAVVDTPQIVSPVGIRTDGQTPPFFKFYYQLLYNNKHV